MGAVTNLPAELVVGWALWVMGGLLLTLWFMQRSKAQRLRSVSPEPTQTSSARVSGTQAVAARPNSGTHAVAGRRMSGTHPAAGRSGTHPAAGRSTGSRPAASQSQSSTNLPDAFAELRALLDQPEEPPRSS